jgi:hypothetical protein
LSAPRNVAVHKRQLRPLRHAGSPIPPAVEPSQEFFISLLSAGEPCERRAVSARMCSPPAIRDAVSAAAAISPRASMMPTAAASRASAESWRSCLRLVRARAAIGRALAVSRAPVNSGGAPTKDSPRASPPHTSASRPSGSERAAGRVAVGTLDLSMVTMSSGLMALGAKVTINAPLGADARAEWTPALRLRKAATRWHSSGCRRSRGTRSLIRPGTWSGQLWLCRTAVLHRRESGSKASHAPPVDQMVRATVEPLNRLLKKFASGQRRIVLHLKTTPTNVS